MIEKNVEHLMKEMKTVIGEEAFTIASSRINSEGKNLKEFLDNYEVKNYERPSVTVDMGLFTIDTEDTDDLRRLPNKELKVLLVKRKDHPFIGSWALPGGFVRINENIEDAVNRKLKEETHIENVYFEQLYTLGEVGRDPRTRVISSAYMALVDNKNLKPIAGDDAEDAAFFTVKKSIIDKDRYGERYSLIIENKELEIKIGYLVKDKFEKRGTTREKVTSMEPLKWSKELLAFDHFKIINMVLDRLKNKVVYTPIAFNLLPEKFTLTQVQQVYELLLGKELLKPNFRRFIKDYVVETDETILLAGHRPSKLFKYNDEYSNELI